MQASWKNARQEKGKENQKTIIPFIKKLTSDIL